MSSVQIGYWALKHKKQKEIFMEIVEHVMFFNSSFLGNLPEIDNDSIKKEIYEIKQKDNESSKKSNLGGWQSKDISIDICGKELTNITKILTSAANDISNLYSVEWDIRLLNFWANVNGHKDSNLPHNHPSSIMSGCYYVECNDLSGKIVFERPDMQQDYMGSSIKTKYTFGTYSFQPEPGDFVIFPSYLRHYVEQNMSNKERISLAFNWR
jgi:uncharacterized protein (TIGR02466 family)